MNRRTFCLRGLSSLLLAGIPTWVQQARANIVLITADDLGWGSLGCYGQKTIQTPRLDALAATGLRFTQAYSACCICAPSRWSLMTGRHVGESPLAVNMHTLATEDTTIAQALQAAGYTTACIGKWGLGHRNTGNSANDKGFDYFFGYTTHQEAHMYYPPELWENEQRVPISGYAPDLLAAKALQFISQAQSPFFLYLPFNLPHINSQSQEFEVPDQGPYTAMPWTENEKNYAAMISRLDSYVGQVIQALPANTIVIFTSDNGSDYPQMFQSNGHLRSKKGRLYEGGIRVPLIVSGPGIVPGVEDSPTWAVNFWQVATSGDAYKFVEPGPMYWIFYGAQPAEAVRIGDFKGIRWLDGSFELYNLASDPRETVDLATIYPDLVQLMTGVMDRYCPDPKSCYVFIPWWQK